MLKATADSNSTFETWKEAPDCAQGITLNDNKICTAIFKPHLPTDPVEKPPPPENQCAKIINMLPGNNHVTVEFQGIGKYIEGVNRVYDALRIIPSSFCEILEVLVPYQNGLRKDFGLVVSLNKAGPNPIYHPKGEDLIVTVTTPAQFKTYIYIDYYTVSAQVVHLFPNPRNQVTSFEPNSDLQQIGQIQEPFGLELVTVIASKTPLFTLPRFGLEQAQSYIQALQQVWPKDVSTSDIATTFYFITTREAQY